MRVTWQGFRPEHASKKTPTTYFTTLPGGGTGSTAVSMVGIGAQGTDTPVEVTLLSGEASLDGTPLRVDAPVMLPGSGSGADLVYASETCTLKVCPKGVGSGAEVESGGAMRMGDGSPGSQPPPPPCPGGNSHH